MFRSIDNDCVQPFKLFKFKLKIVFMICGCADYGLLPSADGGFLWASRVIKVIVCSGVNVILINVIKIIFEKKSSQVLRLKGRMS